MSFQLRCWTSIFWNRRYLAITGAGLWRAGPLGSMEEGGAASTTLCRTTSPPPRQKGTLRGLDFQKGDAAQAKLVRCGRGAVLDVAVDLRHRFSPTYKQWVAVELSAENKRQLLIPRGFGHGFVTLTDDVEFLYKADNLYYAPEADGGIRME